MPFERILLIDHSAVTLRSITELIRCHIGCTEIDAACSDATVARFSIQARAYELTTKLSYYSAIVFDAGRPRRPRNGSPDWASLVGLLAVLQERVLLVYCSAYVEEPSCSAELRNLQGQIVPMKVDKRRPDWPEYLIAALRAHIRGREAVRAARELFEGNPEIPTLAGRPSATMVVHALKSVLEEEWAEIRDEKIKSDAQRWFKVFESVTGARAALL